MKPFSSCIYPLLLFYLVISPCCHKIKKESGKVISKTEEKIENKATSVIEKMIPVFDDLTPDAEANKLLFKEFMGFTPTADIKNIYCFNNDIGIDADYEFAFTCADSSINKIVKYLNLTKTSKNNVIGASFGP